MSIIETEQTRDTRLAQFTRGPFIYRFASYRKAETVILNLRNEDYIVTKLETDQLVFTLCDGVTHSFRGNVGSQILGEALIDWLSNILPDPSLDINNPHEWLDGKAKSLHDHLKKITNLATVMVNNQPLKGKNILVQNAEEEQRASYGTQSNFACGIILPKSVVWPDGLLVLFWLGNARLRIFNNAEDRTALLRWGENPGDLRDTWSSKEGVVGTIRSYISSLSNVTTLIAYSDGLESVEKYIKPDIESVILDTIVKKAQAEIDDDASYLEISVRKEELPRYSDDVSSELREKYLELKTQKGLDIPRREQRESPDKLKILEDKLTKTTKYWKRVVIRLSIIYLVILFISWVILGFWAINIKNSDSNINPPYASFTPIPSGANYVVTITPMPGEINPVATATAPNEERNPILPTLQFILTSYTTVPEFPPSSLP
jgi:hypothetical protein